MTMPAYREAAHEGRRSVFTIKRWLRSGALMSWEMRDGQRVRVVDEKILFATPGDRLDV